MNPLFVQIKQLEVESERIDKWDGDVPQFIMDEIVAVLENEVVDQKNKV